MTDDEVIEGLKAGGHVAETSLKAFARGDTVRAMLRFFVQNGVPSQDSLDIMQETLIRIDRYARNYRGDGSPRAWFWQIARSCLADHWRQQGSHNRADPTAATDQAARREAASHASVTSIENGVKVVRIPYLGQPLRSVDGGRSPWIGTVDDEQWAAIEETVAAPAATLEGQTAAECVAKGFDRFSTAEPERAYALGMQMDGHSIAEIADCIGRTVAATTEYLHQCRKKIKMFIQHCRELQEA
jgi:RNA polymerase sigma factor (sigma-70 family)